MNFDKSKNCILLMKLLVLILAMSCSKSKKNDTAPPQEEEVPINWDNVSTGTNEDWLDKYKSEPTPSPVAEEVELTTAEKLLLGKELYGVHCSKCHNGLEYSTKRNRSAEVIKKSISQVLTMKAIESLTQLSDEEIDFIQYSLDDRNIPEFKSPQPIGLGFKATALIGNRKYITSSLKAIFGGENSEPLFRIIEKNILSRVNYFGGPCGPKSANCGEYISPTGAKMMGTSNVARSGYLIKTCNELISSDQAILNMLKNSNLQLSSNLDDSALKRLVSIFYPNTVPSITSIESIKALFELVKERSPREIDSWRYVGFSLCSSIALEVI